MHIDWKKFKEIASDDVEANGAYIYRGHTDSSWILRSSLFRTALISKESEILDYVNYMLPQVKESVEAWSGQTWNLSDYFGLAEFLAFLQHNGFPTPLLDFTMSPYIAAYFAFAGIDHFNPQTDQVAIYRFNKQQWMNKFSEKTDVANTAPTVTVIMPYIRQNHKLALQQGLFLWSNVVDIEGHIRSFEEDEGQYLSKFTLAASERPMVIRELSLMGITAVQLSPSIESVCKKALEDLIGLVPMRKQNRS